MNTLALILLTVLIAPALALSSHGAQRESWRAVTAGALLLALALGGIPYLLS